MEAARGCRQAAEVRVARQVLQAAAGARESVEAGAGVRQTLQVVAAGARESIEAGAGVRQTLQEAAGARESVEAAEVGGGGRMDPLAAGALQKKPEVPAPATDASVFPRSEPAGMRNLSILEFRDFEPAGDNDPEVEAGQEMIDREIVELWGDACPPLFRVVVHGKQWEYQATG
ncbi:hypothetical protein B0H14DRAFT_2579329 [Mycena olivaceomarginata]|nr:hypothetical protein B0H14DRAFT_2579329 [Mycena olivaceomarginata]